VILDSVKHVARITAAELRYLRKGVRNPKREGEKKRIRNALIRKDFE
jgi:hypothetical protein